MGSRFKQHGGFAQNGLEVVLFGDAGVADVGQLQHFPFRDDAGSAGKDRHNAHRAHIDHHLKRAGVEKVTDQYRGRIAPGVVGGFLAPAHMRFIHHVIV